MQVIIFHGTGGNPNGNWFPWLKEKLENKGYRVYIPAFPTPENQTLSSWLETSQELIPLIDEDTILIGHSCGATFLLHVLEKLNKPIKHAIFVSGFIDELGNLFFDTLNATFIKHGFDWNRIRNAARKKTLYYGDNDPYVPKVAANKLSEKLKCPLTIIKNGGHLNAESGYMTFEILFKEIVK